MINILRTVSLFFLLFINNYSAYSLPPNKYNNRRLGSTKKYVLNKYNERFEVFDELKERLSILDNTGNLITRLGGEDGPGYELGQFLAPHGLSADSRGNIYVGANFF